MSTILTWKDWVSVLPWVGTITAISYLIYTKFKCSNKDIINKKIDKHCEKVVHTFDIEDIGTKICFCRCWKSGKFPLCDGTHNKHNKETGDNIGPVVIKQKDA